MFLICVFQNERFNRFLWFLASLINNNGTLRKCYLFSCRYKNHVHTISRHKNYIGYAFSPYEKESGIWNTAILSGAGGIQNPGLWNPEYSWRNPESHWRLESRIQVPLTKNLESSTWNLESTAWNPESKTVLDFLTWGEPPYMEHYSETNPALRPPR